MLLSVITTVRSVPVYEASTQLLVEKSESTSLVGQSVSTTFDSEFCEIQRQLIISQNVALKVVRILELEKNWRLYFPDKAGNEASFVGTAKTW